MRPDPTARTNRAPLDHLPPEEEERALEGYYRTLAGAAAIGNALATEPPEAEVADLLSPRGVEPTPAATDGWYRRRTEEAATAAPQGGR